MAVLLLPFHDVFMVSGHCTLHSPLYRLKYKKNLTNSGLLAVGLVLLPLVTLCLLGVRIIVGRFEVEHFFGIVYCRFFEFAFLLLR